MEWGVGRRWEEETRFCSDLRISAELLVTDFITLYRLSNKFMQFRCER